VQLQLFSSAFPENVSIRAADRFFQGRRFVNVAAAAAAGLWDFSFCATVGGMRDRFANKLI
jgi:hypothetical protein